MILARILLLLAFCKCSEHICDQKISEICNVEEFDKLPATEFNLFLRQAMLNEDSEPAYRVLCFAIGMEDDHLIAGALDFINDWIVWRQDRDSQNQCGNTLGFVMNIDMQMTTLLLAANMAGRHGVCMEILACPSYVAFISDDRLQDPEMRLLVNCRLDERVDVVRGLLTDLGDDLSESTLEKCLKIVHFHKDFILIHLLFTMAPRLKVLLSRNLSQAIEQARSNGHRHTLSLLTLFHKYLTIKALICEQCGGYDLLPTIWYPHALEYFLK